MNASLSRTTRLIPIAACCALALFANTAHGAIIDYTYTFASDIDSWGASGNPNNVVIDLDLAALLGILPDFDLIGLGWDVTLIANAPSELSDIAVRLNKTSTYLNPGGFDAFPGGPANYANPVVLFASGGLSNIGVSNGILSLEFFDLFDDPSLAPDGVWLEGSSLTFRLDATPAASAVPEPSAIGLLLSGLIGIGGYGAWRRARRPPAA